MGLACALTAFVIWGLVPVFFKLLADVNPLLVTAHRVIWALVMISVYLLLRDGRRMLQSLSIRSVPDCQQASIISSTFFSSIGIIDAD